VAAAARMTEDPGVRTLPIALLLVASGCLPAEELRLVLAAVDPDPLEGATTLRIWFDPGDGTPIAEEIDLTGDGAVGGLSGESILDVRLEALDSSGTVVARGGLPGDLTPAPGEVREETVALLRVGQFSLLEGLQLEEDREGACAVAAGDGRLLIAGGGATTTEWIDVDSASAAAAGSGLSGPRVGCSASRLDDGSVLLAALGDDALDLVDGETGSLVESLDTDRPDGALVDLAGGEAAWWLGGTEDGADLTSELLLSGSNELQQGPSWAEGARTGHAAACTADGGRCAVFGSDTGSRGWWHVAAADVLLAAPGLGLDTVLDRPDQLLDGVGIAGASLDTDHVLALTEDDATHVYVLDLGADGAVDLAQQLPGDLLGCTAVQVGEGTAWILGGTDGSAASDAVRQLAREDGGWSTAVEQLPLHHPRAYAAAALLADGRVVVVGGVDGAGVPVGSIEVYQP